MSQIRQRARDGLKAGDSFSVTRTFTRAETEAFGDLTQDYNPVHYDQAFAEVKGYDHLILHGMLTAGMICEIGGQLAWLATAMSFRYLRPVYFGDTITCQVTINELNAKGWARAEAMYTNQHGEVVVTAELEGQLPGPTEQAVLGEMMAAGDPSNKLG